jgi:hypothetical protein
MATSTDNKEEEQQHMSNSSDRLPHHVSFNDGQQQQRKTSINLDDLSSTSRHGSSIEKLNN